jgi:hypothetical protein
MQIMNGDVARKQTSCEMSVGEAQRESEPTVINKEVVQAPSVAIPKLARTESR